MNTNLSATENTDNVNTVEACNCKPDSVVLCTFCLSDKVSSLEHKVDDLDSELEDRPTERDVERMIEDAFEENDRNGISEDDVDEKVERAAEELHDELEREFADAQSVRDIEGEVTVLTTQVEALTASLRAMQARTLRARWERFVARVTNGPDHLGR